MTSNNTLLIKQVVELIKDNYNNTYHFFSNEKNHKWLKDLEPYGFFNPESIQSRISEDGTVQYPNWPQGIFLEKIAEDIHSKKIIHDEFIIYYVDILRRFYITDNRWAIRSIFKSIFKIPLHFIKIDDVQSCFEMLERLNQKDPVIEFTIHEVCKDLLASTDNTLHNRKIFRTYTKNILKSKDEDDIGTRERKLIYFQGYGRSVNEIYPNPEELAKEKSFLLEDIIHVVSDEIEKILSMEDVDNNSNYWRPAIEDHYQNKYHDSAPAMLIAILFKITNILLKNQIFPSKISDWQSSSYITFLRLYIALVNENAQLLDRDECAEKIIDVGLQSSMRYEIYHFLKKNFDLLNFESQKIILSMIENLSDEYSDPSDNRRPLFTAWKKMRWLQAIKQSTHKEAQNLYHQTFKITGGEVDHPDFNSYMSTTWVGPTSPQNIEDFDNADPNEIVEMLKAFRDDPQSFGKPSVEGLARTLEEYIAKEPLKCSLLIPHMTSIPYIYLSSLFKGYEKAWNEKKSNIPVSNLLDLSMTIFSDKNFIQSLTETKSKTKWIPATIFRFISAGLQNDDYAFDLKLNQKCHEVLKKATEVVKPDSEYNDSSDAYTRAINEPRGVLFETAIHLALRIARLAYDKEEKSVKNQESFNSAWSHLYEIIGPPLLAQSISEISLHAHLGALYRQMLFLNSEWFYHNLDLLCPTDKSKKEIWSAFMQGFCHVNIYAQELYSELNRKGHLLKFLKHSQENEDEAGNRVGILQSRIIELSIIAYLLNDENLNDGLLKEILALENAGEWHTIVRSLPRIVGKNPELDIVEQAKKLISFFINKFRSTPQKNKYKEHLDEIGYLLVFFDDPEDTLVQKIIEVASFYAKDFSDHFEIIKYLEPFSNSYPQRIGFLFYELIQGGKGLPTYPEDKIKSICLSLKAKGQKHILSKICRIYSDNLPHSPLTHYLSDLLLS